MAINKKVLQRYKELYANNPPIVKPISFEKSSPNYFYEENERWLPMLRIHFPDIRDGYYISSHGRIFSELFSTKHPNGCYISCVPNGKGYMQTNLDTIYPNKRICIKVHRAVMLAFKFIPGCENLEVDHIDGNKQNNCIWNLEWVTIEENIARRDKYIDVYKSNSSYKTLLDLSKKEIDNMYREILVNYDNMSIANKYNVDVRLVIGIRNSVYNHSINQMPAK